MIGRGILLAVLTVLVGGIGNASNFSPTMLVQLFEDAREKLPCIEQIPQVAKNYSLENTHNGQQTSTYTEVEYSNTTKDIFLLFTKAEENTEAVYAVSVSVYNSGADIPAEITLAYMDYWNLPQPTPLRTNPTFTSFVWDIDFPNGTNSIVISYSDTSDLTQLYGQIVVPNKDAINGCSIS